LERLEDDQRERRPDTESTDVRPGRLRVGQKRHLSTQQDRHADQQECHEEGVKKRTPSRPWRREQAGRIGRHRYARLARPVTVLVVSEAVDSRAIATVCVNII